jgi:hypothetical protein
MHAITAKFLGGINGRFRYMFDPLVLLSAMTLERYSFGWIFAALLMTVCISKAVEVCFYSE